MPIEEEEGGGVQNGRRDPGRPRATQGDPGRPRATQGVPGRPRATQGVPGRPASQGVPGRLGAEVEETAANVAIFLQPREGMVYNNMHDVA